MKKIKHHYRVSMYVNLCANEKCNRPISVSFRPRPSPVFCKPCSEKFHGMKPDKEAVKI